ncbi:MAG: class I SAM-dependent methyltransferase [Planctomycetota bacterium]
MSTAGLSPGALVPSPKGAKVRRMFAAVAPRYDLLNHTLSGGIDVLWRRRVVRDALRGFDGQAHVLDVCTGTGDLAFAFARRRHDVVALDFCLEMLSLGRDKRRQDASCPRFLGADAHCLPFPDGVFDVAAVAFGIRNVQDPARGLAEMARVVRPGGRVCVLEFARPRVPLLGSLYSWYFRRVLPWIGGLLSRGNRGAYDYLRDSVLAFPERAEFCALLKGAGLEVVDYRLLSFGIAALYSGRVPDGQ